MQNQPNIKKIYALDSLVDSFHRNMHSYLANSLKFKLTLSQLYLLKVIKEQGTSTPSHIAGIMGVTSGAITSLTDKLHKQGLITRERSKTDRRVVEISLTEKGKEMHKIVEQERLEKIIKIISELPEEDIDSLLHIYQKLNDVLKKINN